MKKNRLINFTATLSLVITASHLSGQCTVPGSVTATPSMVCPGSTRSLSAVSPGSSIMWWNSPTLGIPYGTSPSGGNFTVAPVNNTTYYAEAYAPPVAGGSLSLAYTGEIQLIEIPAGVNQVTIDARGAQGGYDMPANGGLGAKMSGVFSVTAGQKLFVLVGQSPGDINIGGYYYPSGGGGSFVGTGLSLATCTPMIVAGGGGGGNTTPGDNAPVTNNGTGPNPGMNGMGAPANTCGGGGGGFYSDGGNDITYNYAGGQGFVNGGAGGIGLSGYQPGGFGGGAVADYYFLCNMQAGAGGGYGGGSGYNSQNYYTSGAAGGSFNNGTNQNNLAGFQSGNGQVIIYGISSGSCVSVSRTPVTVSVIPSPTITISGDSTAVCPGTTVTLTANGANTYSWNTGATSSTIAPTPTANTTYTVWGNSGGCTVSAVANITIYPTPSVGITGNTLICGESGTVVLTAGNADAYSWNNGAFTQTISVSPSVTTVYSVVETNTVGFCSNTFSTTVVVSTSPTVSISGTAEICSGNAVNLTGMGATSYSWSTGGHTSTIAPTPSVNTTYTVVGANPPSQCTGSAAITVTVDPTPMIFTSGSGTICGGQLNALGVQGAYTYTWQPGNLNGFIINVAPNVTTTYTVIGTSMAGCLSNSATATIDVRNCTGIKENSQSLSGLLIYPNPTSGEFSVELSNGLTKLVEITDLTGRIVFSGSEQGNKFSINISRLDNGIYYVKVQSDNASSVFKITKQ